MISSIVRRMTPALAVVGLVCGVAACSNAPKASGPLSEQARTEVRQALDGVVATGIPGVQVVVTEGGREWSASSGVGDVATSAPFPPGAHVRVGSNTKAFVAATMMQLVAEGSVELDAPVERYLPGVVQGVGIDGNRITVRNLMQHTSGLPEYLELPKLQGDSDDLLTKHFETADLVRGAMTLPAHFEPGAKAEYSNTNYLVVGMIVERVTGHPVAEEVTHRVIDRLGLRDTYFPADRDTDLRDPHPRGYETVDGKPVDVTRFDSSWAGSAGALVSTGADVNHFFTALFDGKLLPPDQVAAMRANPRPLTNRPGYSYGLGLTTTTAPCGIQVWGHGGSIPGFRTFDAVTPGGRAVTLITDLRPSDATLTAAAQQAFDTALCAAD
ncbi:serine hydrolase domain-containing protein [Nocardia niigatensis]